MSLVAGFADPVHDSQAAFRAVMVAMARPGTVQAIKGPASMPPPLSSEAAAIILTLADFETPVFLDEALAASEDVTAFLGFHSGARLTAEPHAAVFALVTDGANLPSFEDFARGTDTYPDRSTTFVVQVRGFDAGRRYRLEGPGIAGAQAFAVDGLPDDLARRLTENRLLFPRGVDLILTAPGAVACLPRTTRIKEA